MADKPTVERVSREIIENQLLTSLEDKSKVAMVLTAPELDLLIDGLSRAPLSGPLRNLLTDIKELRQRAFG